MLHFFVLILSIIAVSSHSDSSEDKPKKGGVNGCSFDDFVYFQNVISREVDLRTIDQNANLLSDEYITFLEENFAESFVYSIYDENGILAYYGSRDALLYGNDAIGTKGFITDFQAFGKLNIWLSTAYAVCDKTESGEQIATYISRGGDNVNGSPLNMAVLVRVTATLKKKHGEEWKVYAYDIDCGSNFPYHSFLDDIPPAAKTHLFGNTMNDSSNNNNNYYYWSPMVWISIITLLVITNLVCCYMSYKNRRNKKIYKPVSMIGTESEAEVLK